MRIYFKDSQSSSHARVWRAYNEKIRLGWIPHDSLSKSDKVRLAKLNKIFSPYDRHIPVSEQTIAQWEKELPYHGSSYAEIFKGMIRMAKTCNKMQSEALSKFRTC